MFEVEFGEYPFLRMPEYPNRQPSWYAFVMQFDDAHSNGVTVKQFTDALQAEGLVEVDRPGSTCPIHDLPLFTNPHEAIPRLYQQPISHTDQLDNATCFYKNTIKLPVWAFPEDRWIIEKYVEGFHKVCQVVLDSPDTFQKV